MKVSGSRYGRRIQVANTAAAVSARAKTLPFTGERGKESTCLQNTTGAFVRPVIINTETFCQEGGSSNGGESIAIGPGMLERSLQAYSVRPPCRVRHRRPWAG